MSIEDILGSGAFLCREIAVDKKPILKAVRDESIDPVDTGWQFLCGLHVVHEEAQIWCIKSVLTIEPSLSDYLHLPPGTCLARQSTSHPWIVSHDYRTDIE